MSISVVTKCVMIISMHKYYTSLTVSLFVFLTVAIDASEHDGNVAMVLQQNYTMITEGVNPRHILLSLHRKDVITTEQMLDIDKKFEDEGQKLACEEMISLLSARWANDSLSKITASLDDSGYTKCATALRGKI